MGAQSTKPVHEAIAHLQQALDGVGRALLPEPGAGGQEAREHDAGECVEATELGRAR